jgi:hypothetical protein
MEQLMAHGVVHGD